MPIFKNSRYTKTDVYNRNGAMVFKNREIFKFNSKETFPYRFNDKDRLDVLAYRFLGDSQLFWAILDCNPQYDFESEIKSGDIIRIPTIEGVEAKIE